METPGVIRDSTAALDPTRHHGQLNAILTMIARHLESPTTHDYRWLDLACGRGQILAQLPDHFRPETVAKIDFYGLDGKRSHLDETAAAATKATIQRFTPIECNLLDIDRTIAAGTQFDLITMTNTAHEIPPRCLPRLLVSCVRRLAAAGQFFVYDVESLRKEELGAFNWTRNEMQVLVDTLLTRLGAANYNCTVKQWRHRTVSGWSFVFARDNLQLTIEQLDASAVASTNACEVMVTAELRRNLRTCIDALHALTQGEGLRSADEEQEMQRQLFTERCANRVKLCRCKITGWTETILSLLPVRNGGGCVPCV